MIELLDGNAAAAWGARLAKVQCVPCFPITPQTEQIELFAKWNASGEFKCVFNQVDSEHSVLSAALGAAITGARTYTSTSSQGLMLMHEMLPIVSGTRTPMVMVVVSRGLSAPITLWPDHNDFLAMRDSGWIMFSAETNQEILDSVIISYKIAENQKVLLPCLIGMDGFIHSYTRTEVDIPSQSLVNRFLPPFKLKIKLDPKKPLTLGPPAMADEYFFFRSQLQAAMLGAMPIIRKVHEQWARLTGRRYGIIERYKLRDAKAAIVMIGANTTIAKAAVDSLRAKGKKVGLLRLRLIRPFPEQDIKNALHNIKKIGIIDQSLAPGAPGILHNEIKAALFGEPKTISSYIAGLGGKAVSQDDFEEILLDVLKAKAGERKWVM